MDNLRPVSPEMNSDSEPARPGSTVLAVQTALAALIADGKGTDGLLRALGSALSCAAVLEDAGLTKQDAWLEALPEEKVRLLPLVSIKASPTFDSAPDVFRTLNGPRSVTDEFPGLTVCRLIAPVSAGGERLGWLSLLQTDLPFDGAAADVLGHAAALFAVHLAQQKRLQEIELRLKGNFVEDLVSLREIDPDSIQSRAAALGFDLTLPYRVFVGEIENMPQVVSHLGDGMPALAKFRTELVGRLQEHLDGSGAGPSAGMAIHKNDELIMLVRQASATSPIVPARKLAEDIIDAVSQLFKIKLYIGIGNICTRLSDYSQSYLEAKKALEIGTYMITEGQVRSFEQFKIHALFLSTLKPAELYEYARSQLGALLDYDARHKTELLITLQEFLYLRNNIEGTARSLNMSVSGLKYRLQKIERITGIDLRDYKLCFDLQLALIILQIFGEYRIRNAE